MTNFEKYGKDIISDLLCDDEHHSINKETGKIELCDKLPCENCLFFLDNDNDYCFDKDTLEKWLNEEASEVDWSRVPVDTKVLVSDDGITWFNRYFSHYAYKKVYAFNNGCTSWTTPDSSKVTYWKYTKLAED